MSGKIPTASVPALLTSERATKLLDEVVYERVIRCVDLDRLFGFEQELWSALVGCGIAEDDLGDEAKAMIDRALARIADDPRRYTAFGPLGSHVAGNPFGVDCPDCEDDARRRADPLRG